MAQFGSDGVLGASMISGLVNGIVKQRQQNFENDLATKKATDTHMAELAKNYANGLAPQQDGSVGFVPGYSDPSSPTFANFSRKADLSSLGRSHIAGNKGSMNSKDYFGALGMDLPEGMSGTEVIPVGAMTGIARANRANDTIGGDQLDALAGGGTNLAGHEFDPKLANTFLKNKTAPIKAGPAMPDESDYRAYEAAFGRSGQGLSKASLTAQLQGQGKFDATQSFQKDKFGTEQADRQNALLDKAVQKHQTNMKPLQDIAEAYKRIDNLIPGGIENADPNTIPGVGLKRYLPSPLLSNEDVQLQQAFKELQNSAAHTNFGARQTPSEMARLNQAQGNNITAGGREFLDAMKALKGSLYSQMRQREAGLGNNRDSVLKAYGGDGVFTSNDFAPTQKPKGPPSRSSLYPAGGGQDDLGDDTSVVDPAAVRAKAAQTGGAAVNGAVIPPKTLNAIRQFPTTGAADNAPMRVLDTQTGKYGKIPANKLDAAIKSGRYKRAD